jgi:hypothetical protein
MILEILCLGRMSMTRLNHWLSFISLPLLASWQSTYQVTSSPLTYADDVSPWTALISGRMISQPASAKCLETIKNWIATCDSSHQECSLPTITPLPRRVLDVRSTGHEQNVCLKESGPGETGRYMALSHCWGQEQPLRTLRSNLARMRQGIDWEILPKTFQDAIALTRKLQCQYLWIDSICIIQDDLEDWTTEAMNMEPVYGNSWLTVSAAATSDSSMGCFSKIPPQVKFQLRNPISGLLLDIIARKNIEHDNFGYLAPASWEESLPLFRRGWALQERILSPRNIHFTKDEIVWECNNRQDCECQYLTQYSDMNPTLLSSKSLYHSYIRNFDAFSKTTSWDCWHSLIEEYMLRELTFPGDRLPALAGLASAFSVDPRLGDYVAGHWKSHLPLSLLWTFEQENGQPRTNTNFDFGNQKQQYPTWSWASIPFSTEYLFSGITFSSLYPTASMIAWSQNSPELFDSQFSLDPPYTITIRGRLIPVSHPQRDSSGLYAFKGSNSKICGGFKPDYPRSFDTLAIKEMDVLQITDMNPLNMDSYPDAKDLCLVIVPSTRFKGFYERVGTVNAYWYSTRHRETTEAENLPEIDDNLHECFKVAEKKTVTLV